MAKLARLLAKERPEEANAPRVPRLRTRFYAFLSYSHKDKELADWLHRELERFRVPHTLAGKLTANGVVPRRLTPVFRDQQDLSAGGELADEIKAALAASQFLIVLCSPEAARSRWTNQEIESFKRTRPEGCVLAAVLAGEPFASDIPGRESEECFPPALRFKYDRRGHQTAKRAEPLAADFRQDGEGRRLAFLKLVAGMLGVGLDELVQRDTTRRHRNMAWLATGSVAGMAIASTLAFAAIQARDEARDQRREAEGLVAFMLGDLKDKLEPIGRLDALDGVGSRVLGYYSKQDTSQLTDAALMQRSRALSLMGQVSYDRGRMDDATRLFQEAMAGTAEAIRRNGSDAKRLYEHAQNYFYLGEIARQRGDYVSAERDYREYQKLSSRMVALEPDNLRWRMEAQYGQANVGIALFGQRRFADAGTQFAQALQAIEALASVDPSNPDYQDARSQALAWLADARRAEGRLGEAVAIRQRQVALLDGLMRSSNNVMFRQWAIPAHQGLGLLYASRGEDQKAIAELRAAADIGTQLMPVEPSNDMWKRLAANARLELGKTLLAAGQRDEASREVDAGCALAGAAKASAPAWAVLRTQCFANRARLSLAAGSRPAAVELAQRSLASARLERSSDPVSRSYSLAAAYRLLGQALSDNGDLERARTAWSSGLALLRGNIPERPPEMYEHAQLLRRLGRVDEARSLEARLQAMGYRSIT